MTNQHPEWEKESSLTSPSDRNVEVRWRPEQGAPPLTDKEVVEAMKDLNNTAFVKKFPSVDRTYADPPIPMQNIALLSFTPAKGAIPNENGVFGFAKVRGSYSTPVEADQRAEFLIRNVDSYHQLYHLYVGRPFPITSSSKYSAETSEIDIRKETTKAISENIKEEKNKEQQTVKEMKEREESLLAESEKAKKDDGTSIPDVDPYEEYITLSVKKAQLSWTFLEHLKKLEEVRGIIINTRKTLSKLDSEYPDFKSKYFEKYMDARKKSGLDEKVRDVQDNFMKYMVEDVPIPTIDTNEILPKVVSTKNLDSQDPPSVASQDPPSVASQDPPSVPSQDPPSVPSVASQDPPSIVSEDPPSVASQDPPSVALQDPPSVASQDTPSIVSENSPSIVSEDPPSIVSEDPPSIVSEDPPSVASQDPPIVSENSRSIASQEPSIASPQNSFGDLMRARLGISIASQDPPSIASEDPPLIASEDPPLIASEDPPSIASEDPPLIASKDPPLIASEDPPLIASEDPPSIVSEDPPSIASEDPPSIASEDSSLPSPQDPLFLDLMKAHLGI